MRVARRAMNRRGAARSPNQVAVLPSILFVCWVAVGGRGTLWGAAIGALAKNGRD